MCTRQSRKVIWDMMNTLFLMTVPVEPTFVAFLQHSQTHFHGLLYQFFQISLKNSELKTTHKAFRDCRVHFFRRPFSKQLYTHYDMYTGLFLSLSKNAHFIFAYFLLFCENLTTLATDLCRSSGNNVRSPRALTHTPCF